MNKLRCPPDIPTENMTLSQKRSNSFSFYAYNSTVNFEFLSSRGQNAFRPSFYIWAVTLFDHMSAGWLWIAILVPSCQLPRRCVQHFRQKSAIYPKWFYN